MSQWLKKCNLGYIDNRDDAHQATESVEDHKAETTAVYECRLSR